MKTGFILNGDFVNDPRVINEARILAANGHQVYILNLPGKDVPKFLEFENNVFLLKFPLNRKINNYLFAIENTVPIFDIIWSLVIKQLIKKYSIKIIHAHDLYMAKSAGIAAESYSIPLVLDLHENYPAAIREYRWANRFPARLIVKPLKWRRKEKKYLSYANGIIVLSSHFKESLLLKYPEIETNRISVYPNVPDVQKLLSFKIDKNIFPGKEKHIIFYFGLLSKRRGIITAVEALEIALKVNPALHLLLIGPIEKAEVDDFNKILSRKNLQNHITHYKWKDISEFPSYAFCSSVCISPVLKNQQHESGVANKVFQYMLFGKPLLVSDCIPQLEIIENTGCGLSFRSGDPLDMAAKLLEILSDNDRRISMGENGRKAVLEKYNTEKQGKNIIELYNFLMKKESEFKNSEI